MSLGKRQVALGFALGATLLATYLAPPSADDGVVLSERTRPADGRSGRDPLPVVQTSAVSMASATKSLDVLSIRRRDDDDETDIDVFVTPPPPPSAPAAKTAAAPIPTADIPPPQAPPLPFRAIGRYVEDGRVAVFLQQNEQNLVVRVGEAIDDQYKVESLSGTTLTLRYKPLDQLQTLDIGAPN